MTTSTVNALLLDLASPVNFDFKTGTYSSGNVTGSVYGFGTNLAERFIWYAGNFPVFDGLNDLQLPKVDVSYKIPTNGSDWNEDGVPDNNIDHMFFFGSNGNDQFLFPWVTGYIFGGNGDDIYVLDKDDKYAYGFRPSFQEDQNQGTDTIMVGQSYGMPVTTEEMINSKEYAALSNSKKVDVLSVTSYIENLYYDNKLYQGGQPDRFDERISKVSTDGLLRYSDPSFFEGNTLGGRT